MAGDLFLVECGAHARICETGAAKIGLLIVEGALFYLKTHEFSLMKWQKVGNEWVDNPCEFVLAP